ncbi:MAG: hypothetical protein BZY87_01045, partial [SAR202 cluster bacterium Io17-Chloro-G6]
RWGFVGVGVLLALGFCWRWGFVGVGVLLALMEDRSSITGAGAGPPKLFNVGDRYLAALVRSHDTQQLLFFDLDTDEAELIDIDIGPYELARCIELR